jgi:uncharacterized membrane protein YoaK (UPF0700 family)
MHLDANDLAATAPTAPGGAVVPPLRAYSRLLVVACLFAAAGGYMDAFSYIAHGHVFANSQTGNVVLFAVNATAGMWGQALRHLPPIGAFILGVAAAHLLGIGAQARSTGAMLSCQAIEIAVLSCLTLFDRHLPEASIVPIIAFTAALQHTSFDALGPWTFNSAMTTGNIRNMATGFVLWMQGRNVAANRGKAIVAGLICISFLFGALFGGTYTRAHSRFQLAPCVALVMAALLLTWRERVLLLRGNSQIA